MLPLSIVIPTYNRLARLKRVLAALEQQTIARDTFEVIVVSDGSRDGTDDYLRALQSPLRVTPILQENQGVAVARNAGIARATGELVLFVDDDVIPAPQLIAEHLRAHQAQPGARVVLGPMLTPRDFKMAPWVQWEQAMLVKQYDAMVQGQWAPTARQFYTGNTSLAREHLIATGGFDPAFRRAEDVELAYRLAARGVKFVFNPQAIGWHYAERSFASWLQTPYLYGRNDVIFTRDKNQTWLLPTIFHEYRGRHRLIRALAQMCLDRALFSALAITALKWTAQIGAAARVPAIPRMAYSGIFNLRHYQGVADELGGRARFFAGIAHAEEPARVPGME